MKRTKIVATIGPKSQDPKILKKLSEAGVNVYRMNFSHGDHTEHGAKMDTIRKLNLPGAIMLDTKGPEVRTGEVEKEFEIKVGDKLILTGDKGVYDKTGKLSVSYSAFPKDVAVGDILGFDSLAQVKVVKKSKNDVYCEVIKGKTIISSKRHINMYGKHVSLPTLTEADWKDIDFGIEKKVDFIALSFCRTAKDIEELRKYCDKKGHTPHIIAKIENPEAVENLEEIVEAADGIMVARGDLADEFPMARVPQIQRMIIELCNEYAKPVIVATQMLASMISNIRPTRAEISDVANAVYQRADATMTSEESAKGVDPVNTIQTMADIVETNEEEFIAEPDTKIKPDDELIKQELVKAAISSINYVDGVDAMVVLTHSGKMAQIIANERPEYPVFAFTDNDLACNTMNLLWDTFPSKIEFDKKNYENTIKNAEKVLKANKKYKIRKYLLVSYYIADGKEYPLITIRDL